MTTAHLKRIVGNNVGELIPLSGCEMTIGRLLTSDICVPHVSISRTHCKLKYVNDAWVIYDNGGCNGVYLDGEKIVPHLPQPLKEGTGIYLGPPDDASAAFIFLENKDIDGSGKGSHKSNLDRPKSQTSSPPKKKLTVTQTTKVTSKAAVSKSSAPKSSAPKRKRRLLSTSSEDDLPPEVKPNLAVNFSDSSISSLDSLGTRIKKLSSKKQKINSQSKSSGLSQLASTSASPILKQPISKPNQFENAPSTSKQTLQEVCATKNETSVTKDNKPRVFKELDQLLSEQSDSCQDAASKENNSESLLDDSLLLLDDPYPFSQSIEGSPVKKTEDRPVNKESKALSTKKGKDTLTEKELEELKKLNTNLVKKNVAQRQKLNELFEEMKTKESSTLKMGNMLEEELICNICTEVFIKATTLGCSHTFCEHCIGVWKKKQKRCPICREKITSETRVLIMDNFIDKVVEQLNEEYQEKRKELIANRDAAKLKEKAPKRRRKKAPARTRARRAAPAPAAQIASEIDISLSEISSLSEDNSNDSGHSDSSVEGHGYYGGYGRCYICGRSGHWSNGCPYGY